MNGYMVFIKTNRQNIMNEHFPNQTPKECFTKVAKKGGELWHNLSDKDKNDYNNKGRLYKPKKSKKHKRNSHNKENMGTKSKKSKGKKRTKGKKRKLSKYIKWFSQNRQNIIKEHNLSHLEGRELLTKVGKKAGEIWRSMSDNNKNKL